MLAVIRLLGDQIQEAFLLDCPLDRGLTKRIEADLKPSLTEATMDDGFSK